MVNVTIYIYPYMAYMDPMGNGEPNINCDETCLSFMVDEHRIHVLSCVGS